MSLSLLERIQSDIKDSLRSGQKERLSILRMVMAQIKNKAIEKGRDAQLTEDEIVDLLAGMLRKMEESVAQFTMGGREDLAEKERSEMVVIREFMPEPLSVEQIDGLIAEAIKETHATSAKEMGSVMKWLTPKTMGRADNRVVSQKVKALLGG
ncbi:GatB/YqeY domain-containing protein [Leptospirillum ferrooxidans]|jgi:hypothetical protein|uniref:Glutamyl-tRNA amidotransferase n=1 Tax=Leptospirillum ferrooxidans (strain C2-3) TaxID=1162668 RepID=I0IQZ4_LEPFC|nr:GatB/YqeY domain-containing protein [Leptospirillum ferrooxidans]BAM07693.1 hypothetical protein LFE_2019 [Leptospirillum ferrooxidans C2-3]